jgi:beta-galactosidase
MDPSLSRGQMTQYTRASVRPGRPGKRAVERDTFVIDPRILAVMTRRQWLKRAVAAGGGLWMSKAVGRVAAATLTARQPGDVLRPGAAPASSLRQRLRADAGWKFHPGHANDPAQDFGFGQGRVFDKVGRLFDQGRDGPSRPDFNDAAWQPVTLPHDWAVELPFVDDPELNDFGYKPLGRNFPATSIGWYRRTFRIANDLGDRRLRLEFDGMFRNAMVVLNGHLLGTNFSGYAPVSYDVTDVATYGGTNVLVVRVDATEREGWFYEGAGIYRHVWLETTAPLHVAHWGTRVTSEIGAGTAVVHAAVEIANDADRAAPFRLRADVVDAGGRVVANASAPAMSLEPWASRTLSLAIDVTAPALWSIETPQLYRLRTTIQSGGTTVDVHETPFGIRSIRFDPDAGFLLNGRHVELQGLCNHQDHAGVGVAVPDRLQAFRVERLKAMGANAWRTAHNPPAPELLDACDRLGLLVLDETRLFSSNAEGLSQLERMVRRDRNHPCVIAWSIANEEWSDQAVDRGRRIAETLRRSVHALDPSRPVTAAMDSGYQHGRGISRALDVQGFNYQREDLDAFHRDHPRLPCMGTEVASAYATRGIYGNDDARGYVSAYDVNKPDYGATAEQWWTFYAARAFLAGGFVWTGFDYRGEPSPYRWPCISSHFGVLDTCGFPKDTFYYYQAWWSGRDVLHLFPHWNWDAEGGRPIDVWCFTNLDRVELVVNGVGAGSRDVARNGHVAWTVPYAPGVIEARGFRAGRQVLVDRRETTGQPAGIVLAPDRSILAADGEDLSVVVAQIVDAHGRIVPTADEPVSFTVSGPGRVIGVGSGNPSSHEADHASSRRAFNGLCMALVQAQTTAGTIAIAATSPGLQPGSARVTATPATPRPALED